MLTRDSLDIFILARPEKSPNVYNFGVIAHEVFTDKLPYENSSDHEVLQHHVLTSIKVDDLRPEFPADAWVNAHQVMAFIKATWNRKRLPGRLSWKYRKLWKRLIRIAGASSIP